MVNSLGVLGWWRGGNRSQAAMLGQPGDELIPQVIGSSSPGAARGKHGDDLV